MLDTFVQPLFVFKNTLFWKLIVWISHGTKLGETDADGDTDGDTLSLGERDSDGL
jgi:hypothetical protein